MPKQYLTQDEIQNLTALNFADFTQEEINELTKNFHILPYDEMRLCIQDNSFDYFDYSFEDSICELVEEIVSENMSEKNYNEYTGNRISCSEPDYDNPSSAMSDALIAETDRFMPVVAIYENGDIAQIPLMYDNESDEYIPYFKIANRISIKDDFTETVSYGTDFKLDWNEGWVCKENEFEINFNYEIFDNIVTLREIIDCDFIEPITEQIANDPPLTDEEKKFIIKYVEEKDASKEQIKNNKTKGEMNDEHRIDNN